MTVSSSNNEFVFGDTYPIVDLKWDRNNLANGKSLNNANEAFDTKEVLEYNDIHKTITNFDIDDNDTTKRPVTYFNYTNLNSTLNTSDNQPKNEKIHNCITRKTNAVETILH